LQVSLAASASACLQVPMWPLLRLLLLVVAVMLLARPPHPSHRRQPGRITERYGCWLWLRAVWLCCQALCHFLLLPTLRYACCSLHRMDGQQYRALVAMHTPMVFLM
jgi:hypothetical protein